jgi:serine/threonine protein kinase
MVSPVQKRCGLGAHSAHSSHPLSKSSHLSDILDAIHRAGWLHGDLCARNLAVDACGEVRILDFSHARRVQEGPCGRKEVARESAFLDEIRVSDSESD